MTQLTFKQFVHPLSEFPNITNPNSSDAPRLDLYTMAGLILYTACANNNIKARKEALLMSAMNAGMLDVQLLFQRCQAGDRAAILQMITLIVSGLDARVEKLEPA
jgi:hypothetical protein